MKKTIIKTLKYNILSEILEKLQETSETGRIEETIAFYYKLQEVGEVKFVAHVYCKYGHKGDWMQPDDHDDWTYEIESVNILEMLNENSVDRINLKNALNNEFEGIDGNIEKLLNRQEFNCLTKDLLFKITKPTGL